MRFIQIVFILLLSQAAQAQLDTTVNAYYRSYPLGGSIDLNLGYALVLHGTAGSTDDPFFGYVRGEVMASGSTGYSGWGYQFQAFPVSFLGITAGQFFYDNDRDYTAYDCTTYACKGNYREDFIEGRLALAYKSLFLIGRMKTTLALESNSGNAIGYISPDYSLALNRDRDKVHKTTLLGGYDFNDKWAAIATYIRSEASKSNQVGTFVAGGALFKQETYRIGLLAGSFDHDHPSTATAIDKKSDFTVMANFQWNVMPSVALF